MKSVSGREKPRLATLEHYKSVNNDYGGQDNSYEIASMYKQSRALSVASKTSTTFRNKLNADFASTTKVKHLRKDL